MCLWYKTRSVLSALDVWWRHEVRDIVEFGVWSLGYRVG